MRYINSGRGIICRWNPNWCTQADEERTDIKCRAWFIRWYPTALAATTSLTASTTNPFNRPKTLSRTAHTRRILINAEKVNFTQIWCGKPSNLSNMFDHSVNVSRFTHGTAASSVLPFSPSTITVVCTVTFCPYQYSQNLNYSNPFVLVLSHCLSLQYNNEIKLEPLEGRTM